MLKVTQETLNLGFMRRIMLSVLVWAIGVIYHVDVYASWHIGDVANCISTTADDYIDDSAYIFRSGKRWNGDGDCCGVAVDSTIYYAPITVLNNMVRVYNKEEGKMSRLVDLVGGNAGTSKVVCMDAGTRSAMISFFAQSCKTINGETRCESNSSVDPYFYGEGAVPPGDSPAIISTNVHIPWGTDSKWHNRRRFSCDNPNNASDFYGGAFATGTLYNLIGYAYPVLLVGDGFSSAYENLYTGDCRAKDEGRRLDPNASCWATLNDSTIIKVGDCLEKCPRGYYCPPDMPLGDFFLNSTVSREDYINGVLTSFYENGRRPYGGALQCEPGSYSSNPGSRSCNSCAVGTYQPLYAQTACTTCPSTSKYDSSGSFLGNITGTTSTTGAKSDTECFVDANLVSNGNLLAGGNGLFAFTGTCYYS